MSAERESERGMRVCNERSGNGTGLYTMLSRPRGHVEYAGESHEVAGSDKLHQLRNGKTGLVGGM